VLVTNNENYKIFILQYENKYIAIQDSTQQWGFEGTAEGLLEDFIVVQATCLLTCSLSLLSLLVVKNIIPFTSNSAESQGMVLGLRV
jgi:hypothetical protein